MIQQTIANDGLQLTAYRVGRREGAPVLFLHGITSSADSWLEAMGRLDDRFDCWALDFRGHGDSDGPDRSPLLADYVSDAAAILAEIARPAIVVGHSLGGATGAALARGGHPGVRALFLEDPPLFLDDPAVLATTVYPKVFTALRDELVRLRAAGAHLDDYLELAVNTPSPMGGVAADHLTPRQLGSRARQLAKVDPGVLDAAIDGSLLAGLGAGATTIACPVTVLAANPAYGAAFLAGDGDRLRHQAPQAEIVAFDEVGHAIRASLVSEMRFLDLLERFVEAHS